MASGRLNEYRQFFEYPDLQIRANPLETPSHNLSSMKYVLKNNQAVARDQGIARRYIKSSVEYLFVFDFSKIVNTIFKRTILKSKVQESLRDSVWRNIECERDLFDSAQCMLIVTGIHHVVKGHKFDRICENDWIVDKFKELVVSRSALALVMSILFRDTVDVIGEENWNYFLGLVADDTVLPRGFPEEFQRILNLGKRGEKLLIDALHCRASREPPPPPLQKAGKIPVSQLVCPKSQKELAAEHIEDFGILGDVFGPRNHQSGKRKLYYMRPSTYHELCEYQRKLSDMAPLELGQLGQPLGMQRLSILNIDRSFRFAAALIQPSAPVSPVMPEPPVPEPMPEAPMPALPEIACASKPFEPLPEITYASEPFEPLPEREDPFAEREFQPVDYGAWCMDEDPPAKRVRAQA